MSWSWEAAALAPASAAGFLAWAARGRSASVFAPSLWRGAPGRRAIALTFDDGPSEYTPRLLDVLARHNVPATFFLCGRNVLRLPQTARLLRDAGHEIANHSHSHPRLWLRSPGFILNELTAAQRAIEDVCGLSPRWFRAPYGVRWFGLAEAQRRLGLTGVMWTAIARDWTLAAPAIAHRLLRAASDGAILCLHDGRGLAPEPDISATVQAVDRLLPALLDRGFHFETITPILCPTTSHNA